jgi:integrase
MLKEDNIRTGFLEHDQFLALRNQIAQPLQPLITVAYITGWRINSELLPLQWRNVDFQAGRLTLDAGTTKNEAARTFPFTAEL